ncbi:T9SS type A sorting domain-containing protein [Patescibacteria group bacterium]|nr:T9SS type A sorting domain-containing protein [Patescibacteria group bacterium]
MKKLYSFFVVILVLTIPAAVYSQTIHSVTVSKDTVNMNEKLETNVIWSSTNSNPVITKVSYRDGKIDSVLTNPTAGTQYLSKFFHYYSTPGTFNILVNVGTTSTTKIVVVRGLPNQPPTASSVHIEGSVIVGQTLVGYYAYADGDGDLEGASIFKWYRNGMFVAGGSHYILQAADLGAMISYEVTPVAQTGALTGLPVQSSAVGPVLNPNLPPRFVLVEYKANARVGEDVGIKIKIVDPDDNIVNFDATYGDGTSYNADLSIYPNLEVGYNPSHVYSTKGVYTVNLKLYDYHNLPVNTNFTVTIEDNVTSIETSLPTEFQLYQNYPNPFNPTTNIQYSLPEPAEVSLIIYDMLGREVVTMVNEYKNAGVHNVKFDASSLSTGVYIYRIVAGKFVETKKMTLMK